MRGTCTATVTAVFQGGGYSWDVDEFTCAKQDGGIHENIREALRWLVEHGCKRVDDRLSVRWYEQDGFVGVTSGKGERGNDKEKCATLGVGQPGGSWSSRPRDGEPVWGAPRTGSMHITLEDSVRSRVRFGALLALLAIALVAGAPQPAGAAYEEEIDDSVCTSARECGPCQFVPDELPCDPQCPGGICAVGVGGGIGNDTLHGCSVTITSVSATPGVGVTGVTPGCPNEALIWEGYNRLFRAGCKRVGDELFLTYFDEHATGDVVQVPYGEGHRGTQRCGRFA